ncbi:MAG: hypothetical protein GX613_05390 [Chloroflexi bacterium]|nr:hypothetical protein [Chloroflexota bacterium]
MAGWTVFSGRWGSRAALCVALAVAVSLSACGDSPEDEAIPPTRTLVPPTNTPVVSPIPLTPTPTDLPGPSSFSLAGTPLLDSTDALSAALQRAVDDLVASGDEESSGVRVLGIERFLWPDGSLGCATAEPESAAQDGGEGYRILLAGQDSVYAYHTAGETLVRCAPGDVAPDLSGEPVPPDPIAEAMAQIVVRDWAAANGVSASEVELVGLLSVIWPDTSLGCPKASGSYVEQDTPGYRLVVRAADAEAIYHTSIRDFVRCAPDGEALPDMLRAALAMSEAELAE